MGTKNGKKYGRGNWQLAGVIEQSSNLVFKVRLKNNKTRFVHVGNLRKWNGRNVILTQRKSIEATTKGYHHFKARLLSLRKKILIFAPTNLFIIVMGKST